jgi:aryl-alcohol dehydrogenase-like predicted oxidoreductase
MLLHRAEWLDLWDRGVGEALRKSQERGIVRYVGASVYTVEEARRVLEHPEIDLIQVPCNAWDQRMKTAGILQLAKRSGKLCFIRSIYLQGLLTMPPNRIAERLPHARLAAERWHEICAEYGVGPVELAMRFALSLQCPLIVGVESEEQVLATYRLVSQPPIPDNIAEEIRSLMEPLVSDDIIDPRKWNLQC